MWEAFYPFFEWHTTSWLGTKISDSIWLFPAVETIHILAMAIMFGALLVLNLRLLGIGMRHQSLPSLAKTLMPFVNWGVVIMLLSGYAMFASGALKYYSNDGFKFKMACLATVLIFQSTIYRSLLKQDDAQRSMIVGGGAAVLNFLLWFGVGAGGRAIGFV
jgi:FlaA1/EpsC-like NDP-sugar epimerase